MRWNEIWAKGEHLANSFLHTDSNSSAPVDVSCGGGKVKGFHWICPHVKLVGRRGHIWNFCLA